VWKGGKIVSKNSGSLKLKNKNGNCKRVPVQFVCPEGFCYGAPAAVTGPPRKQANGIGSCFHEA